MIRIEMINGENNGEREEKHKRKLYDFNKISETRTHQTDSDENGLA